VTKTRGITMEMDNFAAHLETVFATEYLRAKEAGDPVDSLDEHLPEAAQREAYPLTGSPHPGIA